MGRIIKLVILLAIVGFVAIAGYAYLGDLSPTRTSVSAPVVLDVD